MRDNIKETIIKIYNNFKIKKPNYEAINELDIILNKINCLESELNNLKTQLKNFPKEINKYSISYVDKIKIAKYLYWSDLPIYSDDICKDLLETTKKDFNKIISTNELGVVCNKCLKDITFKSKNQLLSFMQYNYNVCDECIKEEKKERLRQIYNEEVKNNKEIDNKIEKLKSLPYSEYLKSEHWVKKRDFCLKRADYKCQLCNQKGLLNVHHKTYENLGREPISDLIVLCKQCHDKFHDKLI